jgi:succinate-acetate transporter protein
MPNMPFFGSVAAASATAMAAYFFMWGLFTAGMFFGTLKSNRALQFVFASLAVLFFMLMIRELTGNPVLFEGVTFNTITGIEGIIVGLSAVYLGLAEVLNEANGKTVLPICPVK